MDYGTFFFTNVASVTVFAVCMSLLAWHNRRVVGLRWYAASLVVGLAKLILQGLEGNAPVVLTTMVPNELYLIAFSLQFMGLRWFILRQPLRRRWPWIALALVLTTYTTAYLFKIPYCGNLINIPFVAVCFASAWMLLRHANGSFQPVSRATAAILCLQGTVAAYRAVLTNLRYARPWETFHAHSDPRWLYSLAVGAFLATFMVMCALWFLVTELQNELSEQARTDPLTKAMNRRAMEEAALRETARSIRQAHALSMIVIDIDNFKHLNDTRGHAAGDRALQGLVNRVRAVLRQQDMLARTGGEEFAILLPDTKEVAALAIAERVRQEVEELEVPFETGPIKLTVCAGVAQLDPALGWEEMMRLADRAMYEAKKHGRNLVSAHVSLAAIDKELRAGFDLKNFRYVQTAFPAR